MYYETLIVFSNVIHVWLDSSGIPDNWDPINKKVVGHFYISYLAWYTIVHLRLVFHPLHLALSKCSRNLVCKRPSPPLQRMCVFNRAIIATGQSFRLSRLAHKAGSVPTRSHSPSGYKPREPRNAVEPLTSVYVPFSSRASTPPISPGAFTSTPAKFPPPLAVAAHSPVPVPPPTRVISQRRTDTDRIPSVKQP